MLQKNEPADQAGFTLMYNHPRGDDQTNCNIELSQMQVLPLSQILALADTCLAQARQHKATWLITGNEDDWRLWRAAMHSRLALLREVGA